MRALRLLLVLLLVALFAAPAALAKKGRGSDDVRLFDDRGRHGGDIRIRPGEVRFGIDDDLLKVYRWGYGRHGGRWEDRPYRGEIEIEVEGHGRRGAGEIEIHRSSGH